MEFIDKQKTEMLSPEILHFDALSLTQYKHFVQDDNYLSVPKPHVENPSPGHLQNRLAHHKVSRTPSDAEAHCEVNDTPACTPEGDLP